jgi:hypothetical protein
MQQQSHSLRYVHKTYVSHSRTWPMGALAATADLPPPPMYTMSNRQWVPLFLTREQGEGDAGVKVCSILLGLMGGELLHVDMFAHNKSGIAYRDGNRRSKTVVNHKREPHQQLRLLPSCTN